MDTLKSNVGWARAITAVTGIKQQVVESYTYDSFGNFKRKGGKVKNTYTFTGREWDKEIGLYYYRARYYDAKAGRFISRDPIGFGGGDVNLFSYVGQNPVNWVDSWGLRIDWGNYVLSNPQVRSNIERLNQSIVDSGISDSSFVLRVSGGDRYRDCEGNIRSSTDDSIVADSSQTSPHLISRGARAVDISVIGVSNSVFDNALRQTNFLPANTERNYYDGHTHIALPNQRQYYAP